MILCLASLPLINIEIRDRRVGFQIGFKVICALITTCSHSQHIPQLVFIARAERLEPIYYRATGSFVLNSLGKVLDFSRLK